MQMLEKLKDMICEELENIADQNKINSQNLDHIDKLTHSLKSITTILAMEESGYSNDGYGNGGYGRNGYSNARRRDSRGRYTSGYSRNNYGYQDRYSNNGGYSGENDMISQLEDMEQNARNEQEREMIRKWKNQIQ